MRRAILVSYDDDRAIAEAEALCDAAGYAVSGVVRQGYLNRPKYGISEGAVRRLEDAAALADPDVIVYDEVLRPSQNYNLASRLRRSILDREALILEIFEGRASSAESRLQVKLAQMRYEMSRARERVRLAKMGEQPGFMGIGRFEVDVYYSDIRGRMHAVREKLAKSHRQRDLHRIGRRKAGLRAVSLAGYTSAGKTTLFNRLTGESAEEDAGLFTTLSTTTRRMAAAPGAAPGAARRGRGRGRGRGGAAGAGAYLVSDTVGFISKLPAYMIEAFKSTLEELLYADVIVLVVDASDDLPEMRTKLSSCMAALAEIGAAPDRVVYALNKADLAGESEAAAKAEALGSGAAGRWVAVSALTGMNVGRLAALVMEVADAGGARRGSGGAGGSGGGGAGGSGGRQAVAGAG